MEINKKLLAEVVQTGCKSNLIEACIPEYKNKFKQLISTDIEIDIDWQSFDNEVSLSQIQYNIIDSVYYILEYICKYDESVAQKIKARFSSIEIKDLSEKDIKYIELFDGKLSLFADWEQQSKESTYEELQALLEKRFRSEVLN